MEKDIDFIFKCLDKKFVFFYFVLEAFLDFIYYLVPFSFTFFLTLPFTLEKALLVIAVFILARGLHIAGDYFLSRLGANFFYNYSNVVYQEFYKKLCKLPTETISKYQTGYFECLIEKISSLVVKVLQAEYTSIFVSFVFLFYTLYGQSVLLFGISVVVSVVCVYLNIKIIQKANRQVENLYEQEYEYSSVYNDFISNIRTVKLLNNDKYFLNKIKRESKKCYDANKKYVKSYCLEECVRNILLLIPFFLGLLKAIVDLSHGIDTIGIITFYISLQVEMDFVFAELSSTIISWYELKVSKNKVEKMFKTLDFRREIEDFNKIALEGIRIDYPSSSLVIKIEDFVIEKGDKISIVGQSGQGKTSTINLILGNIEKYKGEVFIDGVRLRDAKIDVGVVSQEIELFNTSIRENLCLDKKVSDEQLEMYLKELELEEIFSFNKGLSTLVGEKGLKLSTGQKRRINLLRSFLMDKSIYILDEPTSNLDVHTEKIVVDFIIEHFKDKTLLLVTHNEEIAKICNKFYRFQNHELKREK